MGEYVVALIYSAPITYVVGAFLLFSLGVIRNFNFWLYVFLKGLFLLPMAEQAFSQSALKDSIRHDTQRDSLKAYSVAFSDFSSPYEGARLVNNLDGVHRYHPHLAVSPVRNDLGNIGSADHQVLFNFDRPFGFRFTGSRGLYLQRVHERSILLSDKAFSNVYYANGQNQENQLLVDFARAFGKSIQAGFHFGRISSRGFYANQENKVTDFSLYAAFTSKANRYRGRVIFDWQDIDVKENGGLLNDSIFEQNITSGRAFIPTNLSVASNHRVGFDIGIEQQLALPRLWAADSSYYSKRYIPVIEHSFGVEKHAHIYADVPNGNGFYPSVFRDSLVTRDSTALLGVANVFRLRIMTNDSATNKEAGVLEDAFVGIGHRYDQVNFDSTSLNSVHNVHLEFGAGGNILGKLRWWASDRFMLAGRNVLDNRIEGGMRLTIGSSALTADVVYNAFRPDFITERYVSNHFMVSNEFGKTNHLSTGVQFRQIRFRSSIEARYHLFQNLVVFGTDRLPYQSAAVNQLVVVRAKQKIGLRWFHVDLDAAVQFILSGDEIRVPMALGRGMVYYQNDVFKRKLRVQIGYEVSYASSYFANAYNPAMSVFHLQNDRQVGNYPFMDFFLNIRIKTFQGFFKMEHWNAGLMGYSYYHVPHYPVNDMAWKFGVRWAFLD